jgi:hypothetical protein
MAFLEGGDDNNHEWCAALGTNDPHPGCVDPQARTGGEILKWISTQALAAGPRDLAPAVPDDQLTDMQALVAAAMVHASLPHGQPPLQLVVLGTAGTGKSAVINKAREKLHAAGELAALQVMAPTGKAAANAHGITLASALKLPIHGDFTRCDGQRLTSLQEKHEGKRGNVVDEFSMVGLVMMSYIVSRLLQAHPPKQGEPAGITGTSSLIIVGDPGQLPPVLDAPPFVPIGEWRDGAGNVRKEHQQQGALAFTVITQLVLELTVVKRQVGDTQKPFREALARMRDAQCTEADVALLAQRSSLTAPDAGEFTKPGSGAVALRGTRAEAAAVNKSAMIQRGTRVIIVPGVDTGKRGGAAGVGAGGAARSSDDYGGLPCIVLLQEGATYMCTANLWVDANIYNGIIGTLLSGGIVFSCQEDIDAGRQPAYIVLKSAEYIGPPFWEDTPGSFPVPLMQREGLAPGSRRSQLPTLSAVAITIHKSQGMSLDMVRIDVGEKELSPGSTFVAFSRARTLEGVLVEGRLDRARLQKLKNRAR